MGFLWGQVVHLYIYIYIWGELTHKNDERGMNHQVTSQCMSELISPSSYWCSQPMEDLDDKKESSMDDSPLRSAPGSNKTTGGKFCT